MHPERVREPWCSCTFPRPLRGRDGGAGGPGVLSRCSSTPGYIPAALRAAASRLRLHLLANGDNDAAVMRGDVIRLLRLVAFLDDEIALDMTRAQILRRALPRLRAACQAIEQLLNEVLPEMRITDRETLPVSLSTDTRGCALCRRVLHTSKIRTQYSAAQLVLRSAGC
jgi:hypothetical protein